MTHKNMPALIILLVITFTFFGADSRTSGAVSASEVGNLLSQKDQICDTPGYIISFSLSTENNLFNDPNQGIKVMECKATRKGDEFAMKVEYNYEHDPVYRAPRTYNYASGDYSNGNLIVWRTMAVYILSTPQRNDRIRESRFYLISPEGKIIQTGDNVSLERYKVGNRDTTSLYRKFKLTCGRGLSNDIGAVESLKTLPDGKVKSISQGSYGPGFPSGKWEITLDPGADYLARKAVFFRGDEFVRDDEKEKPLVQIFSSGVVEKEGLTFAKSGVFKYSDDIEFSVEVESISKVFLINSLYNEVVGRFNKPLPYGASIHDRRGEKMVITTVK